jgi:dipeptidyl-peptidase-3
MNEDDVKALLVYACGFFSNMGNYRGFGDVKIVPALDKEKVSALVSGLTDERLSGLWDRIKDKMYSLEQPELRLGFAPTGVTTYHSENVTKQDAELIAQFTKEKKYEAWNSRLFKRESSGDGDGTPTFDIRLASVNQSEVSPPELFQGVQIRRCGGDYAKLLQYVNKSLTRAKEFAANGEQVAMLERYVESFTTGDVDAHKDGSRHWIKDKGPSIETYIGFIENYRDPDGVRSEFEGFVSAVNKNMSRKFAALVAQAPELLKLLPWDAAYETDVFLRPDFTSLDVISFGSSGIPAGINIPNYDEIRQHEGFKNVSLGNVIKAFPKIKIPFLSQEDAELIYKYHHAAFEVQVGLHELLGHGSGKMFKKNGDGTFNFDRATVKDMETGGPITSWYEEGETWGSKFKYLSSAYEECRAEAVGYCLCTYRHILEIFGYSGDEGQTVKYVNWLSELRAGLLGLEFYSPETGNWGQAHCYARWVLLRVSLEAAGDFVSIEEVTAEDGKPDLKFRIDQDKIDSVGLSATMAFLRKLQLYKATGDFAKGKELFERYGAVDEQSLHWRDIVIDRRRPRTMFVQCNTALKADEQDVELKSYPETFEGIITSNLERFGDPALLEAVLEQADVDSQYFTRYWSA